MKAVMKKDSVLVIADDFTGANDVGVQFSQHALTASVLLNTAKAGCCPKESNLIVNSDSRSLTPHKAAEKVTEIVRSTIENTCTQWIFKKIDSTLRGNIGAEIEAVIKEANFKLAILSSSYPGSGRTIKNGQCFVHGKLITETEFATDPKTPVHSSFIQEIIQSQTTIPVVTLSVEQFQSSDIQNVLEQLIEQGPSIVVADAENDSELQRIAEISFQLSHKPLLIGSAGLAGAFVQRLKHATNENARPLLSMIGTMSEATQLQIEYAQGFRNIQMLELNVSDLFTHSEQPLLDLFCTEALSALKNKQHCIVKTNCSAEARAQVETLCLKNGLSRHELGNQISEFMGKLTTCILDSHHPIGGIFLSGGDIATSVANIYNADFFEIKGQIGGCVPWGYFSNCSINHIPVMTKAGGFGQKHTFLDVINFVEEKASE